jgi:hypothetical protein
MEELLTKEQRTENKEQSKTRRRSETMKAEGGSERGMKTKDITRRR